MQNNKSCGCAKCKRTALDRIKLLGVIVLLIGAAMYASIELN